MHRRHARIALAVVVLIASAVTVSHAQPQSSAQQACSKAVLKAATRLAKTHDKELGRCLALVAEDATHPNVCLDYDPRGKVDKAAAKLTDAETKKCGDAPDFGLNASAAVILAATSETTGTYEGLFFGFDGIDSGVDSGCMRSITKLAAKLTALKLKSFGRCVRKGLADESITDVTGLDACLVSARAGVAEKTTKIVAAGASKIGKQCGSGITFTTCPAGDPASFAACLDTLVDCRSCEMLKAQTALTTSCDDYDNAAADGSCYDVCGNGNVGTGIFGQAEGCDDGNRTSGDGCDYNCTVSGCGNDVTDPSEFCDNRSGKCIGGEFDGLPCFENAQCGSGFCTDCPSGGCDSCGSCAPAVCCNAGFGCDLWEYGQGCFGTLVGCDDPDCQFSGTCCTGTGTGLGNCSDSAAALSMCEDLGGQLIPCSQCSPCCQFDGYCTSWGAPDCLEFEGTPVDCSQCWPD